MYVVACTCMWLVWLLNTLTAEWLNGSIHPIHMWIGHFEWNLFNAYVCVCMCACALSSRVIHCIGEWENSCNELQRMLIVRSLRSDRVPFTVTTFIINNLGAKFVEPPVLNMASVVEDSSCRTPLIFVLSPGVVSNSIHFSSSLPSLLPSFLPSFLCLPPSLLPFFHSFSPSLPPPPPLPPSIFPFLHPTLLPLSNTHSKRQTHTYTHTRTIHAMHTVHHTRVFTSA